jgi:hypothetical protein
MSSIHRFRGLGRAYGAFLVSAACALPVAAQGPDSCATPQAIAGTGTFAFTTGTPGTES